MEAVNPEESFHARTDHLHRPDVSTAGPALSRRTPR